MSLRLSFAGLRRRVLGALGMALAALLAAAPAQAHLMVAQRGTLNFVGNGGFVVMALPVSAFHGIDDDGDGRLSIAEMRAHSNLIEAQVLRGMQLVADDGPRPLEGLMLNLSPDDSAAMAPAAHLVVLGRYALADGSPAALSRLSLCFTLFGQGADAQQQTVTVTQGKVAQKVVLAPGREAFGLFPSAWSVLQDNLVLGAAHVLSGLDHLLFLLVVLATGWGWRSTALALTAFTAGHALTLAAVVLGGLSAPAAIVEPAIACTIIGMAVFDRWSGTRPKPLAKGWRLALVFAFALVHGLGLAGALNGLALDPGNRLLSLVGFNLGIEAAQLGVAGAAGLLLMAVRTLRGPSGVAWVTRLASVSAMAAGSVWLAQRVWAVAS